MKYDFDMGDVRLGEKSKKALSDSLKKIETVNNPKHYNMGEYEALDVINDWKLNFNLGNVIKYVARCNYKGDKVEDLRKAIFYLEKEIANEERNR